jgi:hypothetical protein
MSEVPIFEGVPNAFCTVGTKTPALVTVSCRRDLHVGAESHTVTGKFSVV